MWTLSGGFFGGANMVETEKKSKTEITSIEIINKSNISRATLNNYIKMGLLPRPLVKKPEDKNVSRAKQIGYFPDSVLGRLDRIVQYKKEGFPMMEIVRLLEGKPLLPAGEIQNSGEQDRRDIPVQKNASDFGHENGELFSFEETHAGYIPGGAKGRQEAKTPRQGGMKRLRFSVLVASMQDETKICAELPPDEYIHLIRQVRKSMTLAFNKHFGLYGKHPGNGAVFYFLRDRDSSYLMNAILCALQLRAMMIETVLEWKRKKPCLADLYLNIGIGEGCEYVVENPAAPTTEYLSLGDSVTPAILLSDLARSGEIWTTKHLLTLLDERERKRLRYGIYRMIGNLDTPVENSFRRVMDLYPNDDRKCSKYIDIWTLPVTEIRSVC